jgi:two-component system chemotaxis sensor kinase CheA
MDINDMEITDQFVMEAKEHLDTIEDDFLLLEKQKENPDRKLVDKVFRAIHSIKGGSGFLGLTNIGKLSHVMETLLSMIRAGEMRPESECIDALLAGTDLLGTMLDDVADSNQVDIAKIYNRLNSMLERKIPPKVRNELNTPVKLYEPDGKGNISFNVNEFTFKNIPSHMSLYVLKYDLTELAGKEGKSPVVLIRELLSTGEIIDAKLDISSYDLHAGLPEAPLMYEVLYATILFPDDIQEITALPEDRIVHVGRDGSMESVSEVREQGPSEVFTTPDASEEENHDELPDFSVGVSTQDEMKTGLQQVGLAEKIPELPAETEASFYIPYSAFSEPEPASAESAFSRAPECGQDAENDPDADMPDSWTDMNQTVRISVDILDKLMALASELVLVRNQQLLATEGSDSVFRSLAQRLDSVTSEMQESIMRTRMQPIGRIFRKFPRIVRELGRKHGKDIRLTIAGGKVELDKTILESLTDPLTHLIRNCCDHGIEMPEQRTRAGKPESGHILLNAWHEAGHINIEIRDDGKGIDPELIRRKAVEKGMKTVSEVRQMDDKEALNLILLPGFTTADKVSDLSGRGVGMDVVKAGIEKLSGALDIDSAPGEGTAFHLRLPLTLAIIPCLMVASGPERYAIPQINLVELVCLYDDDVRTQIEAADNQEVFRLRDRLLPMIRLSEVLRYPELRKVRGSRFEVRGDASDPETRNPKPGSLPDSLSFAVLKAGNERFGLIIDRVIGTEEIVVKPMHPCLKSLNIYSGATVMGDGNVSLILDTEGIAAHAGIKFDGRGEFMPETERGSDDEKQTVLLFRYGEKEQFAMALPLIRRIEHISASEISYVGEKEFITVNGVSTRILRLEKVLGVSPGMGKDEMFLILPKYIKRPLGLLASELVDIEETGVELNVESYMADGLLGTAVIQDRMTLFIDIYRLVEKIEPEWFSERRMNFFGTPGPPGAHFSSPKKKVLVAEDISFFRQLIKGYLEADGYEVVTAENGAQALERMAASAFDLIVSDLEMPVMDGWEFVKHVRQNMQMKDIRVMALTALDSEKDREKAERCGYNRYEVKLDRERFLTGVAELLGSEKREVGSEKREVGSEK